MNDPASSTACFPSCSSRVIWNRSGLVSLSFLRAVCRRVFRVASSCCRARAPSALSYVYEGYTIATKSPSFSLSITPTASNSSKAARAQRGIYHG